MIIGSFLVGPPANLRGRAYAEFHNRLKPLVKFEMNGLSFKGATVVKPTSSNWCTLYVLNNGAQLIKYRSRYAIVAATFLSALSVPSCRFSKWVPNGD